MQEEEFEIAVKIVVVGNGGVGKSSMIQQYCKGEFTKNYKKTIGVDFLERQIEIDGVDDEVRIMLWDTAGQEEFDQITRNYYKGAQACVLAFSTIDRDSFEAVEKWQEKVKEEVGNITTCVIQNKIDLLDDAVVEPEEAEALAKKLHLPFFRMSVKENMNVDAVFKHLASKYIKCRDTSMKETKTDASLEKTKIGTLFDTAGDNNENQSNDNIASEPVKRRTGGKKHQKCILQ